MSREVCGICWCPYDEYTGECACAPQSPPQRKPLTDDAMQKVFTDSFGLCPEPGGFLFRVGRAVERAHGIGGEE